MSKNEKRYYCKRCRQTYPSLLDDKGNEKIVKLSSEFTGRQLTCKHMVSILEPALDLGNQSRLGEVHIEPQELRDTNIAITLEFSKLNDEQKEAFILYHIDQYRFHMKAVKKEKYIVQLAEDLIEKWANQLPEPDQRKKEWLQRIDYIFRKPEKKLEILAKEKEREGVKAKKVEESKDSALARLRELMRKSGLKPEDLG